MSKIIIKESDLVKLIETAMDLDIYVQPMKYDTDNGNKDIEQSTEEIVSKLKELLYMFKTGKKTTTTLSGDLYGVLDQINDLYDKIKYED